VTKIAPWSFSRIKDFDTCPKQFYHKHILKELPFEETEATRYGNQFHKAAEEFIRNGTPVPDRFAFARPTLEALDAKPGDKFCEYKFGLTRELEPCSFYAKDVWFRGIIDLLIVHEDRAWIVDYKTGKSSRYAETGQLELMALATFKFFPHVTSVNAGLVFVVADEFVKDKYALETEGEMWAKWLGEYAKMEKAAETGVWNPKPSGLCRAHCKVLECPHNGRGQ
jgi:RecB family exonuclease